MPTPIPDHVYKHIASVDNHRKHVIQAATSLVGGIGHDQLMAHDLSKYEDIEVFGYAAWFHGPEEDKCEKCFQRAWHHHYHNNPHHWQYWLRFTSDGSYVPMEMPIQYTREMVADWLGSSMSYTHSFDMTDWLNKNWERIALHNKTRAETKSLLHSIGFEYGEGLGRWVSNVEW